MLLSVFYWIFMPKREQMNQQQYLLTEQYRLDVWWPNSKSL